MTQSCSSRSIRISPGSRNFQGPHSVKSSLAYRPETSSGPGGGVLLEDNIEDFMIRSQEFRMIMIVHRATLSISGMDVDFNGILVFQSLLPSWDDKTSYQFPSLGILRFEVGFTK